MASTPSSQRSAPDPMSSKIALSHSPVDTDITMKTDRPPGFMERRGQIAEQVEELIKRQTDPKGEAASIQINRITLKDVEPMDWASVRNSDAPWGLVARDGYDREKGWERGKQLENYFAKYYRCDDKETPIFNWKYHTPENSTVSEVNHWRSSDWLKERITRRPNAISKFRRVKDNPQLVAALKRAAGEVSRDENFLKGSYPGLGTFWKGVKVLGRGGQGVVGLWEYIGPNTHVWGRRIVIKQSLQGPLDEEREMMAALDNGTGNANHAVRLLHPLVVVRGKTPPLHQIILEFCEGGDLDSLIFKHKKNKEPFSEENLWLFFECFAKCLNLMDHANESPEREPNSRNPICHFDIKPLNVLRGKVDDEHKSMPINKIADFGLAAGIDPVNYLQFSRRRGTEGYLAPEQFSGRWGSRDALRSSHINIWGTHTNIWQVGVLMYMLATLSGPPRPKGFRCSAIGKKLTYGFKLKGEKYSTALRSLIWRCLCDKPKDRPDLMTLNKEIASGLAIVKRLPAAAKPEQNLGPPEPQDPQRPPDPPKAQVPQEPSKGPPPAKGIPIPIGDKTAKAGAMDKAVKGQGTQARPKDAATGTRAAPFIIPGGTKILRKNVFTFCIVPKHLPQGKQEPIWFRAALDSTVRALKQVIRNDAGLDLADDAQFIYLRLPDQPFTLMDNAARMLSLYGVGQDMRLELWTDKEAHDAAEPTEAEFDVL